MIMQKQTTQIQLSKYFSIVIGNDMIVIDYTCNWDTDNDDISSYSEEIGVVLSEKKFNADKIEIYNEKGKVVTVFYIVYLFIEDWNCILFSKENFDAEITSELRNNTATVDINKLITCGNIKYQNTKLSEFLQTEKANYICDPFKPVPPRYPRFDWKM